MATRVEPYRADWRRGKVASWVTTTDHKRVGILFALTGLAFLLLGAALSGVLLRVELRTSELDFLSGDHATKLLTLHGLTTLPGLVGFFLGLTLHIAPLQVGVQRARLRRVAALAYWLFLFGGLTLYLSWFTDTRETFNDVSALGILIVCIGGALGAVSLLATVWSERAPDMTWQHAPVFAWSALAYALALLVVLPVVAAALTLFLLGREELGQIRGAYRIFAEPQVALLLLPALGVVSEVLGVFGRRSVARSAALAATLAFGAIVFAVWAWEVVADGGAEPGTLYAVLAIAAAAAFALALVTWLASVARGVRVNVASVAALAAVAFGGLAAVLAALAPRVSNAEATEYDVATVHAITLAGLLAACAALYYWWPKLSGRLLGERLGYAQLAATAGGAALLALAELSLGLDGMRRGFAPYDGELEGRNDVAFAGGALLGIGLLLLVVNLVRSRKGRRAGSDPWSGDTLEWYTTSPPPPHNFDRLPPIESAHPVADVRARLADGA